MCGDESCKLIKTNAEINPIQIIKDQCTWIAVVSLNLMQFRFGRIYHLVSLRRYLPHI